MTERVIPEAAIEAAIELQAETQEHIRRQVIPEAAVEAAARSLYRGKPIYDEAAGVITGHQPWEWMEPEYQDAIRKDARAALEVAAPYMGWWELGDTIEEFKGAL